MKNFISKHWFSLVLAAAFLLQTIATSTGAVLTYRDSQTTDSELAAVKADIAALEEADIVLAESIIEVNQILQEFMEITVDFWEGVI